NIGVNDRHSLGGRARTIETGAPSPGLPLELLSAICQQFIDVLAQRGVPLFRVFALGIRADHPDAWLVVEADTILTAGAIVADQQKRLPPLGKGITCPTVCRTFRPVRADEQLGIEIEGFAQAAVSF